ncbi:efflux RND transporter permease subunit, partial [Pseudomonas viridiflava]|uniref:efflux RND transporter permease subunit n=1 Tax=Pseudomonas viridiflava TaxID=33069 RepID=UPI001F11C200
GFDYAVLKDYADRIQIQLHRVKDVGQVELIGLQDEKIWIELSNVKLATLGLPLQQVQQALQAQNGTDGSGAPHLKVSNGVFFMNGRQVFNFALLKV